MGVLFKCLLGVFAVLCLMQFVKMHEDTTPSQPQADLQQSIMDALAMFPTPSPADVGKFAEKLTETLQDVFKDGRKQLGEVADRLHAYAKERLAQNEEGVVN